MSDDLKNRLINPESAMRPTISDGRRALARIEELEAKLARAVGALEEIATDEHPLGWIAIATLAKLKGETGD